MEAKSPTKAVVSDKFGNEVIINRVNNNLNLSLKLAGESRTRDVGFITMQTRVFHVSRIRSKHLFLKNNSYGFNHKILEDAKLFDNVEIKDDKGCWLVPKDYILKEGKFLHFKKDGFERQIFIELIKIEQFKVQPTF